MQRQQLREPGDGQIRDLRDDISEPGLWVDAVQFCGANQAVHESRPVPPALRAGKRRSAISLANVPFERVCPCGCPRLQAWKAEGRACHAGSSKHSACRPRVAFDIVQFEELAACVAPAQRRRDRSAPTCRIVQPIAACMGCDAAWCARCTPAGCLASYRDGGPDARCRDRERSGVRDGREQSGGVFVGSNTAGGAAPAKERSSRT